MHVYLRGSVEQRLRLASGLVLMAFAATHFLNHALGLVSFEAMHAAQDMRTAVTRSVPGTIVLLAALLIHIALGLLKLSRRSTWRMPRWEALQIVLGLAIPFLLFPHIVNTRIAHTFFGVNDTYLYELKRLWPENAVNQSLLLLLVWVHGCIGLHYWLRLSERYRRAAPALLAVALLVPALALAGFAVGGRATDDIMSDPEALQALKERSNWPNAADSAQLATLRSAARVGFASLAAIAIGAALVRGARRRRGRAIIRYVDGPTIDISPGMTLLEASRAAGVPHASVCGGRGRCSTCRVRIEEGLESLPRPVGAEAITLKSIEAPPNVRLACQVRPCAPLTVAIVTPPATPGPTEVDFVELKELVAAHVRARLSGQLVEFASSDADAVARWFEGKVDYAVSAPDLSGEAYALLGGRVEYLLGAPAAALVYERHEQPVTLIVVPEGASALAAVRGQRNGTHVVAWAEAGMTYFAVSDLAPGELERLEASRAVPAEA